MKGEVSDVVMETKETVSGNDLDTFPLLSPPEIFQVEQGTSKSEESELEKGLGACCRICLESESLAPGDELIAPCMCKGTQQLVHRGCLDHWRSVKVRMSIHSLSILTSSTLVLVQFILKLLASWQGLLLFATGCSSICSVVWGNE
jgi:hypothetical protein